MALAHVGRRNRLLAALPADAYRRLEPHLSVVELPRLRVLLASGARVDRVHLPVSGLSSVVVCDVAGRGVSVATVGREGAVGLQAALAAMRMPAEVVQQVPGIAVRVARSHLVRLVRERAPFRRLIDRYLAAQFVEALQGSACHRVHGLEARMARALLTTRDRVETDGFPLTHEVLALMVGGSRPRVSLAAQALEADGLIAWRRGEVGIRDPVGLEVRSCECYATIRDAMRRAFEGPAARRRAAGPGPVTRRATGPPSRRARSG
jgi:CRP-like cAMP-binding protein